MSDEMVEQYAVVGTPQEVPGKLEARFGGVAQRVQLDDEWFEELTEADIRELVGAIQRI